MLIRVALQQFQYLEDINKRANEYTCRRTLSCIRRGLERDRRNKDMKMAKATPMVPYVPACTTTLGAFNLRSVCRGGKSRLKSGELQNGIYMYPQPRYRLVLHGMKTRSTPAILLNQ